MEDGPQCNQYSLGHATKFYVLLFTSFHEYDATMKVNMVLWYLATTMRPVEGALSVGPGVVVMEVDANVESSTTVQDLD